jgi:hypothetical protein
LLKVSPNYEGTTGTDLNVLMKVLYRSDVFDAHARVNEPVRVGAVSILPEEIGISPQFILKERDGKVLFDGYFILNVLKGDEDSFQFPGHPYTVSVRFYPDHAVEDGKAVTRSLTIANPVFHLRIEEEGRTLYDAFRRPGERASFGAFEVSCGEIRYWVDLFIVREYGTTPLYAGFLVGTIGLIMRLIFYQKTIRVHVDASNDACLLYLTGSVEFEQHAFRDELARLAADMADAIREKGKESVTT